MISNGVAVNFTKYLIPAILAFAVSWMLWQIQKDRIEMDYEVIESATFPRTDGAGKYYIVRLRNSGNRSIENIELRVEFQAGVVESAAVSEPSLVSRLDRDGNQIYATLPLLNPREVCVLTATTDSSDGDSNPKVTARAAGATAVPRVESEAPSYVVLGALLLMMIGAGATIYRDVQKLRSFSTSVPELSKAAVEISRSQKELEVQRQKMSEAEEQARQAAEEREGALRIQREESQKEREKIQEEQGKIQKELEEKRRCFREGAPDTPQVVFSVLSRAGLGHRFSELTGAGSYWATAAWLLHRYLVEQASTASYLRAMRDLSVLDMAPSSKGFVLYLLSKMERDTGDTDAAVSSLRRCQTEAPLMYEFLMGQDPAYDLNALRKRLLDG